MDEETGSKNPGRIILMLEVINNLHATAVKSK